MNTLEIIQNRSFIVEWVIPNAIGNYAESYMSISETVQLMNIYKNNEIFDILSPGQGLTPTTNQDNTVSIITCISDPSYYELDQNYTYELKVYDKQLNIVYEESGNIIVIENKNGETLEVIAPYDLINPRPYRPPEERRTREERLECLAICKTCPEFFNNMCAISNSFMPSRTEMRIKTCPLNKWQ